MERRELAKLLGGQAEVAAPARIVIRPAEANEFRPAFANAVASSSEVFLEPPGLSPAQQERFAEILRAESLVRPNRGWLMIPTGGTSGGLKFARHDGHSIAAAVRGFGQHFGLRRVNAVGVLPLHHVSGFMAWMRCVLTAGQFVGWEWKQLERGEWPTLAGDAWVISLVPTQLDRLLKQPLAVERLRLFRAVFLGGAPAWPDLLARAAEARLPISLSYGMTETAAMIAALRPEEFLAGDRTVGTVMPHARVMLDGQGVVQISGSSLFRGYFPQWRHERTYFATSDLGHIDARGRLRILGRRDAAIISGGEKVHPAEVEAALRPAAGTTEFAIIGLPDAEWGERVVCVYASASGFDLARVQEAASKLAPAERPKAFLALAEWPRSATDKLDRARLRELAGKLPSV